MRSAANGTLLALTLSMAGCASDAGESTPPGTHPDDVKPGDAAELEGNNVGTAQVPHTQHYVDSTNLWNETAYPMGTDNPNCKSWWVYDRFLGFAPPDGSKRTYSTAATNHAWARGTDINRWMNTIPPQLGYDIAALIDHNSVVARASGKCSGRYIFQWNNHESSGYNNFLTDSYNVVAYIPPHLIPSETSAACNERDATSVPHIRLDLYACEAPAGTNIGSFTGWCGSNSSNWRKARSDSAQGWYNSYWKRCDVTAGVRYDRPAGKVAVSFNVVVKAGIGHGVAPALLEVTRY
jgi:hypothetical protein